MVSRGVPVLVLGLVAIYFSQTSAGVHHVLQSCADQTGTSMDDANVFVQTGNAGQNLKCAFKCVMKTINVINDDGTMNVDTMVALNPADKADLVRKCTSFPAGDPCENAYLHYKCALDNDPDYFKATFSRLVNDF